MSVIGNFTASVQDSSTQMGRTNQRRLAEFVPYDELVDMGTPFEQREAAAQELARSLTGNSAQIGERIFSAERGSEFDPFSPKFDARKWTQGLSQLAREAEGATGRMAGVSFKSMSVYGYGSDSGKLETQLVWTLTWPRLSKDGQQCTPLWPEEGCGSYQQWEARSPNSR